MNLYILIELLHDELLRQYRLNLLFVHPISGEFFNHNHWTIHPHARLVNFNQLRFMVTVDLLCSGSNLYSNVRCKHHRFLTNRSF